MENFKFEYEPYSPVGNEFQARWGQDCGEQNCLACAESLYHYYDGKTLHIWVDKIAIRWVVSAGDFFAYVNKVVLHSDNTLDYLERSNSEPAVKRFIQNLKGKE